jgi:tetratricopeptide (TPR) repeat protein
MNTKEKVLINKGMDRVKRGQFQEALETFDRVLVANPSLPEAWNNKGVALFRLGNTDEALQCYDRSLALDAENLEALRNKGFALRNAQRFEEALQCYDSVLKAGGEALDYEATATVLVGLGRLDEALQCLLIAVEKQPLERFEEEIELLQGMIAQAEAEGARSGERGQNPPRAKEDIRKDRK